MQGVKKENVNEKKQFIILLIVVSILLITAGYFYYYNEEVSVKKQKQNELKAIAELKINQIAGWYKDEFSDVVTISNNTFLIQQIEKYLQKKALANNELIKLLSEFKTEHNYAALILFSSDGEIIASTEKKLKTIKPALSARVLHSLKTDSTIALDVHYSFIDKTKINLGFVTPVQVGLNNQKAALVVLLDADEFLFPIIRYWPVQTSSSETVIFRKENDSILYLNELNFQRNTALKLRLPMQKKDLPAVQAVLGKTGIFDGRDYRGVEVFAYLNSIDGTPWYLVAKIDKSELLQGLQFELASIIIITILLILTSGAGLTILYSKRQRNVFEELYKKEKELWQAQQKFKVTIDSLGEGVITTDTNGKVQYLNKIAENLTGWNNREARGRKLSEIYSVKNEETGLKENNIVNKVFKHGIVKELANHTILVSKSGKEIPVMDTGAPVYDSDGSITGLVLTFQDETEKRRQRNLLAESEKRFRSSLDNMIEGCQIIGSDWRYIYINDAAVKHNRRPKEELLGNKYADMWPGIEKTEVYSKIKNCLFDRTGHIMENEFFFPDGTKGWFELKIQPINDGALVLSYDITNRKLAEEEYKKLSRVVIQSPVSVVITDPKGNIEYANPKFTETTGYTLDEVIGKNPRFLKSGTHSKEFYENMWDTILSGKEWKGEIQNKNKKGELYWDYVTISPMVNNNGDISHFVELKEDITDRKKMIEDLVNAKVKAEELNKVKSHFFANMSHELRTPFVGIMGYAELLADTLTDPEEREMAIGILNTSKRMKDTLTKILNLSKFEFNGIELAPRRINPVNIIANIYNQFAAAAENKNLSFYKKINLEDLVIETDETLFTEIIKNLVSNAIIYTNEGSVEISAETQTKDNNELLVVKVLDTGIGIPLNKQEIVWEEFRQASEGLTRSFQGTGLGLSIAKKYTGLLGGRIFLQSQEGVGSTFTFELPVKNLRMPLMVKDDSFNAVEINDKYEMNKKVEKKNILHVEDDIPTVDVVRLALSKYYNVDSASDSDSILSKVEQNKFDAILMDINLCGETDGIELTKQIRKLNGYETIPIVAVTAYASDADKKEFLSKGMSHYIAKPFMMKELLELINGIFQS